MTGFYDWLGRVIMLVLAGMITLSIIGSIAAIPSGSITSQAGLDPRDWPRPEVREQPVRPSPPPAARAQQPQPQPQRTITAPAQGKFVAPAPEKPPQAAEWLETIAYALFALVGLAALAVILLWRALQQWRRSADALETRAARRG
jgi:hypothetical protein